MITFEIGEKYFQESYYDSDVIFKMTVINRTKKFLHILCDNDDNIFKLKIRDNGDYESVSSRHGIYYQSKSVIE